MVRLGLLNDLAARFLKVNTKTSGIDKDLFPKWVLILILIHIQMFARLNMKKQVNTFTKLYIKLSKIFQTIRLEAGRYHVMDAISQCEQDAAERGVAERDTPWQLIYRKEMFAPWQGLTAPDPVSTNLIYRQITAAVHSGEYRCTQVRVRAMYTRVG